MTQHDPKVNVYAERPVIKDENTKVYAVALVDAARLPEPDFHVPDVAEHDPGAPSPKPYAVVCAAKFGGLWAWVDIGGDMKEALGELLVGAMERGEYSKYDWVWMTVDDVEAEERLPYHDEANRYGGYSFEGAVTAAVDAGTIGAWEWLQTWAKGQFDDDDEFNDDGTLKHGPEEA